MGQVNQYQKSEGKLELTEADKRRMREKAETIANLSYVDVGKTDKYSAEQKLYTVVTWLLTRNLHKTAEHTQISINTLRYWKYHSPWWNQAVQAVMSVKNEELDHRLTDMIDLATDELTDRLKNGDHQVLKDGSLVRKPVSARDLMIVLGTTYDKRALMRGDPTARTERKDTDEKLQKLTDAFQTIAKNEMKVIDGTTIHKEQAEDVTDAERQEAHTESREAGWEEAFSTPSEDGGRSSGEEEELVLEGQAQDEDEGRTG